MNNQDRPLGIVYVNTINKDYINEIETFLTNQNFEIEKSECHPLPPHAGGLGFEGLGFYIPIEALAKGALTFLGYQLAKTSSKLFKKIINKLKNYQSARIHVFGDGDEHQIVFRLENIPEDQFEIAMDKIDSVLQETLDAFTKDNQVYEMTYNADNHAWTLDKYQL